MANEFVRPDDLFKAFARAIEKAQIDNPPSPKGAQERKEWVWGSACLD